MNGRFQKLLPIAFVVLLAGAVALVVWPDAIETLTGIPPQPELAAPDDLPAAAKDDPLPFLERRDQIEIRVTEATTLRQFLDRNRLNKETQVRQITGQLGSTDPKTPIPAGTTFRIRLTPAAADVPGTTASRPAKTP